MSPHTYTHIHTNTHPLQTTHRYVNHIISNQWKPTDNKRHICQKHDQPSGCLYTWYSENPRSVLIFASVDSSNLNVRTQVCRRSAALSYPEFHGNNPLFRTSLYIPQASSVQWSQRVSPIGRTNWSNPRRELAYRSSTGDGGGTFTLPSARKLWPFFLHSRQVRRARRC